MMLPAQYAWFEPVLIASVVVFIIDLIGNSFAFGNRYVWSGALVDFARKCLTTTTAQPLSSTA